MTYRSALGRRPLIEMLAAYLGVEAATITLTEGWKGKPLLGPPDASARRTCASGADAARPLRGAGQTYPPETDAGPPLLRTSGKPPPRSADATLSFNWSHSGDYALLALARDGALGVDIEQLRERPRALDIARRFFDPMEADALAVLEPAARGQAFIGLWCAKEAVLKAAGEGISFGLARLAFTPRAGMDWTLARIDPALGEPSDWQLSGFEAVPGYRGALAWRGGPRRVLAFDLAKSHAPDDVLA